MEYTPVTAANGVEQALKMLEGRWKLMILFHLFGGKMLRFSALEPTFKGVWSTAVNFAPLPSPDTKPGRYPQHHRRAEDSPGHHGLGS